MKSYLFILLLLCFACMSFWCTTSAREKNNTGISKTLQERSSVSDSLRIPKRVCKTDHDKDSITDVDDLLAGARIDVKNKPAYDPAYCRGGYPADSKGVCTDLVWRAYKNAGFNLKNMIDEDIRNHLNDYKSSVTKPDPNIDFRRVKNQATYFRKYGITLTNKLTPGDSLNLSQWQPGDIVTFRRPEHIAMISDLRRADGVPYLLHNCGPYAREEDTFMDWAPEISGHYRFPK
jgi:uncharacterized protein YijF (DUF1287 family)